MSNLSIDDLLKVVESKKRSSKRLEDNSNVRRYLEETGWEAGTLAIPTYVIFWHYRTMWKCDRHHKTNKIVFFRCFNKRFPAYRKNKQRFYLLKEGIIELTQEVLDEAKLYDKKFWKKESQVQSPT